MRNYLGSATLEMRLTEEEGEAFAKALEEGLATDRSKSRLMRAFVDLLLYGKTEMNEAQLDAAVQAGRVTHGEDTTVRARPSTKRFTDGVRVAYEIIRASGPGGITDEEAILDYCQRTGKDLQRSNNGWRSKRKALRLMELIRCVGELPVRSGNMAQAWAVVDPEREVPEVGTVFEVTYDDED